MIVVVSVVLVLLSTVIAVLSSKMERARQLFDWVACLAIFIFSINAATAVLRTNLDGTVFMTEVHSVLMNPAFLISGAYLGIYGLARVALIAWRRGD
ncbi:transposase [Paenibacillus sp. GSMTC-2017]|uniref:transposase n=1 Tax=Paenibacillus sp. GSMTC-2017 TaxID=2794350 RepID=UPI0018D6B78D|nr:transposase [Paenibacillus sp. GSMTC-2017]MBH5317257.1 transposase [Paenibacillus sp. GSMTC-2017]